MAVRKVIIEAFRKVREAGVTTLLTLEKDGDCVDNLCNIPYLVDGIINLDYLDLGTIERRIFISKMRWTAQFVEGKSYEISSDGIVISEDSWGE